MATKNSAVMLIIDVEEIEYEPMEYFETKKMTTDYIADRVKKSKDSEKELKENIIDYAKDKCITLLMLSGMKHCDAGYLVNQNKKIFK